MSEGTAEPLRSFLRDYVFSFEQLRALLCLASDEARAWSSPEVAAASGVPPELVNAALTELAEGGQLVQASLRGAEVLYFYAPARPALRSLVSQLAQAYAEQRLAVIRMMNDNALHRVRSTAARQLAEAFRLDREKK